MADFKKAMFQKRIDKVKELKPVTIQWNNQTVTIKNFEALQQLMKEAVESDLVNVSVTPGGSNNIRAQATDRIAESGDIPGIFIPDKGFPGIHLW